MFDKNSYLRIARLFAGAGIGIGVCYAGLALAHTSEEAVDGPVRCEIRESSSGAMTTLEALVHADRPTAGSYEFSVEGGGDGGSSRIRQGGDFEAAPDNPAKVGSVMLGGSGGAYDARLEVSVDGETVICEGVSDAL